MDEQVKTEVEAAAAPSAPFVVDSTQDNFLNKNWYMEWRTVMAWSYVLVCVVDFALAPLLVLVSNWFMHVPFEQAKEWVPVTLQGGGFYHLAMGAVLGVSSWTKGNAEKVVTQNLPDYNAPLHH